MSPVRTSAERASTTRIATGCAVVWGSGFLLCGLFFIYLALTAKADPDDRMAYYFALLMGSFFAIGGAVMLDNIRREYGDLRVASELESAAPGRPWLWRSDWVAGYSVEKLREGHQQQWLWTIGWGLITTAVLWEARKGMPEVSGLRTVVAAIVLGAIVLLSLATYRSLRTRRYGDVRLYLHTNPYRPGRVVSATLKATSQLAPTGPMNVTLAYVHEYVTHSGRASFTHEKILWSDSCAMSEGGSYPRRPESSTHWRGRRCGVVADTGGWTVRPRRARMRCRPRRHRGPWPWSGARGGCSCRQCRP